MTTTQGKGYKTGSRHGGDWFLGEFKHRSRDLPNKMSDHFHPSGAFQTPSSDHSSLFMQPQTGCAQPLFFVFFLLLLLLLGGAAFTGRAPSFLVFAFFTFILMASRSSLLSVGPATGERRTVALHCSIASLVPSFALFTFSGFLHQWLLFRRNEVFVSFFFFLAQNLRLLHLIKKK